MMAIVLKIETQLLTRLQVGMGVRRRLAIFLELIVIACWLVWKVYNKCLGELLRLERYGLLRG